MPEIITLIVVGVAITGIILTGQRGMETRIEARLTAIESRLGVLERQQAKLEGLLEGLREAISGRVTPQQGEK